MSGLSVWPGLSVLQISQHLRGGPHLRPRPGRPLPPPQLQREVRPVDDPRLLEGGSTGRVVHLDVEDCSKELLRQHSYESHKETMYDGDRDGKGQLWEGS